MSCQEWPSPDAYVTPDGLTLYGVVGERAAKPDIRFTMCSRKATDQPFANPVPLSLPEVDEFTGWYPRPVKVSHELFFCSQRLSPVGDMDIWLVRDFWYPSTVTPEAGKPSSLSGTWLAFTEETGGKRVAKAEMQKKRKTLRVEGDKFTLSTTYYKIVGTIRQVPGGDGHAIDLVGRYIEGGNGKDVMLKAIFDIRQDTLRFCYSYNVDTQNNDRPTEFETDESRPGLCVTFKKSD